MLHLTSKMYLRSIIFIIALIPCIIGFVLASSNKEYEYRQKLIHASKGGQITMSDGTRLDIPAECLAEDTLITMERAVDPDNGAIAFTFSPHGMTFNNQKNKSAILELSWSSLKDVDKENLILYYWDEYANKWEVATTAEFHPNEKKVILYIDHFSYYYYTRQ